MPRRAARRRTPPTPLADLKATRAEVLVRYAVAREVDDRPQQERRKSRPARRAGGGARATWSATITAALPSRLRAGADIRPRPGRRTSTPPQAVRAAREASTAARSRRPRCRLGTSGGAPATIRDEGSAPCPPCTSPDFRSPARRSRARPSDRRPGTRRTIGNRVRPRCPHPRPGDTGTGIDPPRAG